MPARARRTPASPKAAAGDTAAQQFAPHSFEITVKWEGTDAIPPALSNVVAVQVTDGLFVITFGRVEVPVTDAIAGTAKHQLAAYPTAKVAIPAGRMAQVLQLLADSYTRSASGNPQQES